jgi:uroporphyrinogen-III synthase
MLILVTRPEPQASQWARQLVDLGQRAQALPLMDMGPPTDPLPVQATWEHLNRHRCLMFVSPNAVQWFARQRPCSATWPEGTLLAAPGPGTAQAALAALDTSGLQASQIVSPSADSEQFDSEHLWPMLSPLPWGQQSVVVVGGGEDGQPKGRHWLSDQWRQAGAQVSSIVAYERHLAQWDEAQRGLARQAYDRPASHAWLLSSSQAVSNLVALMGPPPDASVALCTHPKVAATAQSAGFGRVVDTRPQAADVAQACQRLADH